MRNLRPDGPLVPLEPSTTDFQNVVTMRDEAAITNRFENRSRAHLIKESYTRVAQTCGHR